MNHEMVWINEGSVLNDAGHLINTSFVDLRKPEDRTPITGLVRGCERKYALEDCETLMISQPSRFRTFGEELILDVQEGLAKEQTVVDSRGTPAETTMKRAVSDLNQALELSGSQMDLTLNRSLNATNKHNARLTYGKDWWILSTSLSPGSDEWEIWKSTLPKHYDHVSTIGEPAKFAQALARMVAEQIGPRQEGTIQNTTAGTEIAKTSHKLQWVFHGPVVYVDSVYDTLDAITDNQLRIAASIFTKGRDHAEQKEYRFAVLNEGADEETVTLQISGMMRDALKQTEHGLVRRAPVSIHAGEPRDTVASQGTNEASKPIAKQTTVSKKSAEREEWRFEARGPDGQVLSSEGGIRESVKEQSVTQSPIFEGNEFQKPLRVHECSSEPDETRSTPDSLDASIERDNAKNDQEVTNELALDEFEWDNRWPEEGSLAIPIHTATGRVYKSFEEMMDDPSYPMSPMVKVWQEDSNTSDEIIKTYRAIDVLHLKMKDVDKEFRQDIASAGWYAMYCIRNIYAGLGDIVGTLSIERDRFVVIRLKNSDALNAKGRIVIAPSGAYAYSLHLPDEERLGYGGLEWGTMFFPIGDQIEKFERYGWTKKAN